MVIVFTTKTATAIEKVSTLVLLDTRDSFSQERCPISRLPPVEGVSSLCSLTGAVL